MTLTNLIRNVVVVGSLTLPVYGCGDDVTNNYEGGARLGSGGSSNGSQALCVDVCKEYGCAADLVKGAEGEGCVDGCVDRLSDCSSSTVSEIYSCRRSHPCNDTGPVPGNSWIYCIEDVPGFDSCYQ